MFFTIGVSILAVVSGEPYRAGSSAEEAAKTDARIEQAEAIRGAKYATAIQNAADAAAKEANLTNTHRANSLTPTSSPTGAPTSAPSSAPSLTPTSAPTRGCFPHTSTLATGADGKQYWYDNNGCRPLMNETWCPSQNSTTEDGLTCVGKCVQYQADGSHCVEVDISGFHTSITGETGGFHAYPNCSSLDEDTTFGDYDETGALMTGLKNKTWFNNVEHTDFVPGWYWCQKQKKCLHPQHLHQKSFWVGTCDSDEGGNWNDHIFEAADKKIFNESEGCKDPTDASLEEMEIFPESYEGHCKIYELPSGNSYSQDKTTQCASGSVTGCEGAVAFYFSIAGFGHNYNFNFCLSKEVDDTTGKRSNDWNNGITTTPAPLRR